MSHSRVRRARVPADTPHLMPDEAAADALMELLEDKDGIVSYGTGSWEAAISLEASDAGDAATIGTGFIW